MKEYEANLIFEALAAPKNNSMVRGGKPTNLYKAAVCVLKHGNQARSKDILGAGVVSNWHNLVPLMTKSSPTGEVFFTNSTDESGRASIWSITEFGYSQYKEAAEFFGEEPLTMPGAAKEEPAEEKPAEKFGAEEMELTLRNLKKIIARHEQGEIGFQDAMQRIADEVGYYAEFDD